MAIIKNWILNDRHSWCRAGIDFLPLTALANRFIFMFVLSMDRMDSRKILEFQVCSEILGYHFKFSQFLQKTISCNASNQKV